MAPTITYNVALIKGFGLQTETLALLPAWKEGMSAADLTDYALQYGILGRATAERTKDIIYEQFSPRYLCDNAKPARQISVLLEAGAGLKQLNQIFLIHTARANRILADFITEVYWPFFAAGKPSIGSEDAVRFIDQAYRNGKIKQKWADTMVQRIASGLIHCLADFDLAERGRKSSRKIQQLVPERLTALYLVYDLHFSGYSDNSVIAHPDWLLFGLEPLDVVQQLQRISGEHFIFQFSGEFARFSWTYTTIEEAFHALAATEL